MFVFDEAFKTTHLPYLAFAAGHNAMHSMYCIQQLVTLYESFNHEIQVLTVFRLRASEISSKKIKQNDQNE